MTNEALRAKLDKIADSLVPVAGELMRRACSDKNEHLDRCNCPTCRAFLATHAAINDMETIMRAIEAGQARGSEPKETP